MPAPRSSVAERYTRAATLTLAEAYRHCTGFEVALCAGCHVGVWPKMLAEKFAKVFTFEPDPVNVECAKRNLDGLENVTLMEVALSDKSGPRGWERSNSNTGKHRLSPDGKGETVCAIEIDSLDLYACNLITLDVEGHEMFALKGAAHTIERFRPVVLFEDNGRCRKYGVASDAVQQWLAQRGYSEAASVFDDRIWTVA